MIYPVTWQRRAEQQVIAHRYIMTDSTEPDTGDSTKGDAYESSWRPSATLIEERHFSDSR